MEDKRPPTIEDLVFIADYSFDADRLRHLESRICNLFNFRLHKVTPFHFLHVNLRASQACQRAHCHHFLDQTVLQEMNLYLLEICRASYCLAQHKPSLLAAACMYLSRATLGLRHHDENSNSSNHNFWSPTLEYFTGYTVKDMSHVIIAIHRLHMGAENSNVGTTPAYSKYKTAEKLRVSLRTVRRLEDIGLAPTEDHDDLDVDDQDYSVLL